MSAHTPEPWHVGETSHRGDIGHVASKNKSIATTWNDKDYANARRIVACVNACKGADSSILIALESIGGLGEFWKAAEEDNAKKFELMLERDELLAALKAAEELYKVGLLSAKPGQIERVNELRKAAITKAEAAS